MLSWVQLRVRLLVVGFYTLAIALLWYARLNSCRSCVHLVWLAATAGESFLTTEDACMTCSLKARLCLLTLRRKHPTEYMGSVLAQYLGQTF